MLLHFWAKVSGTDPDALGRDASAVGKRRRLDEETKAALPAGTEIVVYSAAIAADVQRMVAAGGGL